MNYKIEGAIKRNRKNFIIYAILWVVIAIVFVSPFSYSAHVAGLDGKFSLEIFIETFGTSITNPFGTFGNLISSEAIGNYISTLLVVTIFYTVFFLIGLANAMLNFIPGVSPRGDLWEVFTFLVLIWGIVILLWLVDILKVAINRFKIPVSLPR